MYALILALMFLTLVLKAALCCFFVFPLLRFTLACFLAISCSYTGMGTGALAKAKGRVHGPEVPPRNVVQAIFGFIVANFKQLEA